MPACQRLDVIDLTFAGKFEIVLRQSIVLLIDCVFRSNYVRVKVVELDPR